MAIASQQISRLGNTLAPSVVTFGKLRMLLHSPNAQRHDIVNLLRIDQALTFHVIRLTNSVAFSSGRRIDSLEDAVDWVGFGEIYRLVGLAALAQVHQADLPTYRITAKQHWANAVVGALAMEALAQRTEHDKGIAYTAGLLRTIGRVINDSMSEGQVYPGESEWPSIAEWEETYLGITSEEITVRLFEIWNYPEEMGVAVRGHLNPPTHGRYSSMACLLNLAGGIASSLGHGMPGEACHWTLRPEVLDCATITEADLKECTEQVKVTFAALKATAPGA